MSIVRETGQKLRGFANRSRPKVNATLTEAHNEINGLLGDFGMPNAGSGEYLNTGMLSRAGDRMSRRSGMISKLADAAGDKGSYWDELWKTRKGASGKGRSIGGNMLRDAGATAWNWGTAADWGKKVGGAGGLRRAAAAGTRMGAVGLGIAALDFLNPFSPGFND